MSSVDKRVVELSINNKQFISGIKESLTSLTELKQAMQMEKATQSLSSIDAAMNKMDFSGIQNGILAIQDRFSTWGIVSMQVISEITSSVINLGKRLANTTVGQINTGGNQRATNIQKANLMLEGLLDTQDEIDQALADANAAVMDTAYGLDEASIVAAQLVASGVEIGEWGDDTGKSFDTTAQKATALGDDMSKALIAISGLAGMTGSSYSEIGQIFTTVASNGRLMTDQVRQFSARGLNVAAALGEELGKSESEINEMVTKGQISFKTFANAMLSAFGDQAYQANRTFTGVMSNTKAALSKIGANFWTPLIQNTNKAGTGLVNLVQIFKTVKDKLNDFNAAFATPLGNIDAKDKTDESKWGAWVKAVDKVSTRVQKSVDAIDATAIGESLLGVFEKALPKVANGIVDFLDKIDLLNYYIRNMKKIGNDAFASVFGNVKVDKAFFEVSKVVKDIQENLSKLVSPLKLVQHAWNTFTKSFVTPDNMIKVADILENIAKAFNNFIKELTGDSTEVFQAADSIGEGLGGALTILLDGLHAVTPLLEPLGSILGTIARFAIEVAKALGDFISSLAGTEKSAGPVSSILQSLGDAIKKVADTISINVDIFGLFESILEKIKSIGSGVINFFKKAKDAIVGFLSNTGDADISNLVGNFLLLINSGILTALVTGFVKLSSAIKNFSDGKTFAEFIKSLKSVGDGIPKTISNIGDAISGLLSGKNGNTFSTKDFKQVAEGILLLAGALFLLSTIEPDKMAASLGAIAGLLTEIGAFIKIMNNMKLDKSSTKNISKLSTTMAKIGFAMLELAGALKIISTIEPDRLTGSLLAVFGLLMEVASYAKILNNAGIDKSIPGFLGIATGLVMAAVAMKILATMGWEEIGRSLVAIAVVLAIMGTVIGVLGKLGGSAGASLAAASSILIVSLALVPITLALVALSFIDGESLGQAMMGLIVVIAALAIVLGLMAKNSEVAAAAIPAAGAILIASLALVPITAALVALSFIDGASMATAMAGLIVTFALLATVLGIMASNAAVAVMAVPAAASMLIASLALIPIATAIMMVGSMGLGSVVQGVLSLVLTVAAIAIEMAAIGVISPLVALGAVAMMLVGAALKAMAPGMLACSVVDGTAVGEMLVSLIPGLTALSLISPLLLILGAALLVLGAGFALFAPAMATLSVVDGTKVGQTLTDLVPGLSALSLISPLLAVLGAALLVLGVGLLALTPGLLIMQTINAQVVSDNLTAVTTALQDLSNADISIDTLAAGVIDFATGLTNIAIYGATAASSLLSVSTSLTTLSSTITSVVESGVIGNITTTLEQATTTIQSFSTSFTTAALNLMLALVLGITTGTTLVTSALSSLQTSMIAAVSALNTSGYSIGYNFIQGIINGMNGRSASASATAYSIGTSLLASIKSALDINSPSKEGAKIGNFLDLGLIKGMRNSARAVYNAGTDVAEEALAGMNAASSLDNIIDGHIDPTIKPLMDISDIQNSMSTIDGLFGQRSMQLAAEAAYGADIYNKARLSNADMENLSSMLADYISNQEAAGDASYEFSIPLSVDGKTFAKATAKYTQQQLNVLNTRSNRKKGTK